MLQVVVTISWLLLQLHVESSEVFNDYSDIRQKVEDGVKCYGNNDEKKIMQRRKRVSERKGNQREL